MQHKTQHNVTQHNANQQPTSLGRLCSAGSDLLKAVTAMFMSGPLLTGYTQTINDWYDRDIDAINEPYRPRASLQRPSPWEAAWVSPPFWTNRELIGVPLPDPSNKIGIRASGTLMMHTCHVLVKPLYSWVHSFSHLGGRLSLPGGLKWKPETHLPQRFTVLCCAVFFHILLRRAWNGQRVPPAEAQKYKCTMLCRVWCRAVCAFALHSMRTAAPK